MVPLNRRATVFLTLASLTGLLLAPPTSLAEVIAAPRNSDAAAPTASPSTASVSNEEWKALLAGSGALGSYHREDGTLVVVVPASGSSLFRPTDAAALGVVVTLERRNIEPETVASILTLVGESPWTSSHAPSSRFAYFSPRLGKVRIFSDAPASEFANLLDKYSGQVDYVGRSLTFASRHSDTSPHWGGAEMDGSDIGTVYDCTSGFAVRNSNGNSRMVTASHCFTFVGETVNSPAGSTFGTVTKRDNFPTNDFELVGGSGATSNGLIYCKQSATLTCDVISAANPNFVNVYCFSGATSWEACQQDLIDSDFDYCHNPPTCTLVTPDMMLFESPAGLGACPGDSGSPWYRYSSGNDIVIAGITSLGEDFEDDLNACKQYAQLSAIEKWTKIRDTYNVTLIT